MTREDIIRMAQEAGLWPAVTDTFPKELQVFVALVASAEREKLQGQIETLHAMYELASKQRDALMDEQRAQVAAMRGRIQ